jgi:Holliday junction resolvasome RuvABC endonuclease subunit
VIFGIDPGTKESGWAFYDPEFRKVRDCGTAPNDHLRQRVKTFGSYIGVGLHAPVTLAVERFEARGMAVGEESVETILWTGRFIEAWYKPEDVLQLRRSAVKSHLCGSQKATDANIRQALIDMLGAPGSKKNPGPTYGVTSHAWAALAVAVTAIRTLGR